MISLCCPEIALCGDCIGKGMFRIDLLMTAHPTRRTVRRKKEINGWKILAIEE
jgi:hypothetical protein